MAKLYAKKVGETKPVELVTDEPSKKERKPRAPMSEETKLKLKLAREAKKQARADEQEKVRALADEMEKVRVEHERVKAEKKAVAAQKRKERREAKKLEAANAIKTSTAVVTEKVDVNVPKGQEATPEPSDQGQQASQLKTPKESKPRAPRGSRKRKTTEEEAPDYVKNYAMTVLKDQPGNKKSKRAIKQEADDAANTAWNDGIKRDQIRTIANRANQSLFAMIFEDRM
jgi:hypothetical protein